MAYFHLQTKISNVLYDSEPWTNSVSREASHPCRIVETAHVRPFAVSKTKYPKRYNGNWTKTIVYSSPAVMESLKLPIHGILPSQNLKIQFAVTEIGNCPYMTNFGLKTTISKTKSTEWDEAVPRESNSRYVVAETAHSRPISVSKPKYPRFCSINKTKTLSRIQPSLRTR